MTPELTSETWAQIRYDYEHSERPIEDICAEHGISSGTLRDRRRRWGWTLRRPPIPRDGPPPAPAPQIAAAAPPHPTVWETDTPATSPADAPHMETSHLDVPPLETPYLTTAPHIAAGEPEAVAATPDKLDDSAIVPRLQSAVARVLPAIESIVAKFGAGPMQPRDMERAARALASLTRTLRELNSLLGQQQPQAPAADPDDEPPEDIDEFRRALARRIHAFVDQRTGRTQDGEPIET